MKETTESSKKESALEGALIKIKKRARIHRKVLHLARSKKSLSEPLKGSSLQWEKIFLSSVVPFIVDTIIKNSTKFF